MESDPIARCEVDNRDTLLHRREDVAKPNLRPGPDFLALPDSKISVTARILVPGVIDVVHEDEMIARRENRHQPSQHAFGDVVAMGIPEDQDLARTEHGRLEIKLTHISAMNRQRRKPSIGRGGLHSGADLFPW